MKLELNKTYAHMTNQRFYVPVMELDDHLIASVTCRTGKVHKPVVIEKDSPIIKNLIPSKFSLEDAIKIRRRNKVMEEISELSRIESDITSRLKDLNSELNTLGDFKND